MPAIQTNNLRRVYKMRDRNASVTALDGVSLEIEAGEVHGLLGPNGAGKTTLVKMLSTVLLPSSGTASILGHDIVRDSAAIRSLIGIVFGGDRGIYGKLSGRQNLEYWAALYNVPIKKTRSRVDALLERVGLSDRAEYKAETYSRGMKQRLHLARGLIANARVLFFDEPSIGMDPLAARDFRKLVKELRNEDRTILLTTHDMAEAEAVCDRVTLIDHGQVVAVETPRSLAKLIAKHERIDFEGIDQSLLHGLQPLSGVSSIKELPDAGWYRIELTEESAAQQILSFLVEQGVTSIRTSRPSLEEVYVQIVGDRGLQV